MSELRDGLRVMVVGKDARTDAIAAALAASPSAPELIGVSEFRAPGLLARTVEFYGDRNLSDLDDMTEVIQESRPDFAVIGPEEPLAAGLVDLLEDKFGVPSFGPREANARVEASKSWCRELVDAYDIGGNPRYGLCRTRGEIRTLTAELGRFVVKPDGLTGGKGVKLSHLHFDGDAEAVEYAEHLLDADGVVTIEEVLKGEEFSLQTFTDGSTVIHTPLVQDHKRALDGDEGPNTGGMGSYSCADFSLPFLQEFDLVEARRINEAMVTALGQETGVPYRGVLYGGFMATADGVRLIEYNCRFGDPEAMNVLPLLETDLLRACWNAAHGNLGKEDLTFKPLATVCRYVVPEGYPTGNKHAGAEIRLDPSLQLDDMRQTYWAAVREDQGRLLLTGSRALGCVGIGHDLGEANRHAGEVVAAVEGPISYRTDIGSAELLNRRIEHMRTLRA
jgi:phosphoribosylamine---glycine ligase